MSITPAGWSAGVLFGLPIAGFFALLALALMLGGIWRLLTAPDPDGPELRWASAVGGALLLLFVVVTTALSMWPYKANYHRYYHVAGTLTETPGTRLIGDGDGMAQRFVVVLGGIPYGIDDTRASLLRKGDKVSLMCKRDYQFRARSGWVCNWGG